MADNMYRLTVDEVMTIRRRMATYTDMATKAFGQVEPLKPNNLETAVFRQHTGIGNEYKYDTVSDVGATLFYGIAMNHPFENANKRTALVSLLVFLDRNRYQFVGANDDDLYELARSMAAHEIPLRYGRERTDESEVEAVADFLRRHTRAIVRGDDPIRFKEMCSLLEAQGCTISKPKHNKVKIRMGARSVNTGRHRLDFDVPVSELKRIRRGLGLDEQHGMDSASFYSLEETVDGAVLNYRNLMSRLADL
ncbi:type II toxin-antitoxin system death-on-curing family toxin [Burkholderia stagnalis]|nr:type II toxin-antitoxin system death-on-curing family toxin [Burkholderia stagnalis]